MIREITEEEFNLTGATAYIAKDELKIGQRMGDFQRDVEKISRVVDDARGKSEEQVRHGGWISYSDVDQAENFYEVVKWILKTLSRRVPEGPGPKRGRQAYRRLHYKDSFAVVRGSVKGGAFSAIATGPSWKADTLRYFENYVVRDDDVFSIINPMPYARRIEEGSDYGKGTATRGWSKQAPHGVLLRTFKAMSREFGNSIYSHYEYRQLQGSGLTYDDSSMEYDNRARSKSGREWLRKSPARRRSPRVYPVLAFGPARTLGTFLR